MEFKARTTFDKVFEVGILLKALDGALEVLGAALLLFIKPSTISHLVTALTQSELSEDPRDFIATHLIHATQHIAHGTLIFGAIYLFSHGIAKIILVVEILRNRLWAYPGLIILTIGFIVYQVYRFTYSHAISLVLLTIFDIIVVYLTWVEYGKRRTALAAPRYDAD